MAGFEHHISTPDGGPEDSLDLALRTGLRTLSDQARYTGPPAPAVQIRSRGTRRHQRRMIATAAVAAVAVAAAVTVSIGRLPSLPDRISNPANTSVASLPTPTVEAAPDPAHDAGYLMAVQSSGGRLMLLFNRVTLTKDGGVSDLNPKLRTFTVANSSVLGGESQRQQLVDRVLASEQKKGHGLLVTLAHQGTADGVVTSLRQIADPEQAAG